MSVPTTSSVVGDGDRQAAFAATLADEWVRAGVAHAVVCPGSRSAPLTVAVAAQHGLVVHVRLDERSAGFTALGIGKATGRPAVVVVTSGTAAAELHPAVLEADLAGVPMIVCTADRPPEHRDVGAPQTADQTHLFGRAPRWFVDPGVPDDASRSSWRSLASRAVAESVTGPRGPGPVHLNLPFRKPLHGDPGRGRLPEGRPEGVPWHRVVTGGPVPPADVVDELVAGAGVIPGSRGLIVAGEGCGDPAAIRSLADTLAWPVLADPRSGLRAVDGASVVAAADGVLRAPSFAASHRPDVVLALGGPWASTVVTEFLTGSRTVVVDPTGRWSDPERAGDYFVRGDATSACEALAAAVAATGGGRRVRPSEWAHDWSEAEERAWRAIRVELGEIGRWNEPALAHRLVASLPPDARLVVSSSMPIRDVEAFGEPRAGYPQVLANRGANGVDGVVSTALGVSLAAGPTVALVGDLAFFHDATALIGPAGEQAPLTVVVADNGGGGIFSFLPVASALGPETFEPLFATPQAADVAAVAAGFGWTVDEIDGTSPPDALAGMLDRAHRRGGQSVVRVRLPDRASNVAAHDRITAAVVAAVDGG